MKYSSDKCRKSIRNILSIFLFSFSPLATAIDASVNYEVEGDGFHRTIRYHIETGEWFKENCYIALRLSPDPTLYVNVDELADLWRHGKTTACSDGEIDVEAFAEKAGKQIITICAPLKTSGNDLSLPLHQRYQLPQENEKYVNCTLPKPQLLLGCKERIKEFAVSKLELCSPCVDFSLKWREIPYRMKTKDYIWMVAVGDLGVADFVSHTTFLTVCLGTIIILRAIWYSRSDKGYKIN